ncbi:MAG: hypothetical protein GXP18_01140 [Gammaproteobacteria bacterium]|nr:hypothetical protein [Gammaproteobacteria bacterium]
MAVILLILSNTIYTAGNFNIMFGNKILKEDGWKPIESQSEYGFGFGFEIKSLEKL